jgi:hypothetical protein
VKAFFRSAAVQGVLGWLVAAYIEIIIVTLRWRYENRAPVDGFMEGGGGAVALFWHGRIAQGMACRPVLRNKPRKVMISLSRDGDFIARAAARLHIPPVRGSASRADGGARKGGAKAFREALAFLRAGGVMILTPDGPRGPREVLPAGPLLMAKAAGCPAFIMSLAAHPAVGLNSWDKARVPLPFARAQVVFEGPLAPPGEAGDAALEAARLDWQARMRAGQARADALLAQWMSRRDGT